MCKTKTQGKKGSPREDTFRLIPYTSLPDWMKDNPHIHHHYRKPMESWTDCFNSGLFLLHNESVNIWSHGLGFLAFIALTVYCATYLTHYDGYFSYWMSSRIQRIDSSIVLSLESTLYTSERVLEIIRHAPIYGFEKSRDELVHVYHALLHEHRLGMLPLLVGACVCLLGSTIFHLFWNKSPFVLKWFSRIDYSGIIVLAVGHAMSGTQYALYCRPDLIRIYRKVITVIASFALALFFHPKFEQPEWRTKRTITFILVGSLNIVPVIQSALLHSWDDIEFTLHVRYYIAAMISYLIGAIMFASLIPEKFLPGKFDLMFNSHNFLHFFVLLGACIHFYGCIMSFDYRLEYGCTMSPFGL